MHRTRDVSFVAAAFDFIFRILSYHVILSGTLTAIVLALASAGMSLFYDKYNISITTPETSFMFNISIIMSIAISIEAQTRLSTVCSAYASIKSIESTISQMTGFQNYDTLLTNHSIPNFSTLAGFYQQRLSNINTIRITITARSYSAARTVCVFVVLVYVLFLQSRHTAANPDYIETVFNHFAITLPLMILTMLIHDINAESVDIAQAYTKPTPVLPY